MSSLSIDAQAISRFRKERYLLSLPEGKFRDELVRPLFLRLGYSDGRDVCGPTEQGKDVIFAERDKLGFPLLIAVQTKKGNLNLARKATANIEDAVTQLRTALATSIPLIAEKKKDYPARVILCASGKINDSAKRHIVEEVKDPRIQFLDANDLIPLVDRHLPEVWFGIDTHTTPYFRAIKHIVERGRVDDGASVVRSDIVVPGANDEHFLSIRLFRASTKMRKARGQIRPEPYFEEFPVTAIVEKPNRRVIITGEAGSGKSTALLRIAYLLAEKALRGDKGHRIPVLLRAIDIVSQAPQLLVEYCNYAARKLINSAKPIFSLTHLQDGRLTVLIDALDEVSDVAHRRKLVTLVDQFHHDFPKCQVILSSRPTRDLTTHSGFDRFNLTPISFRQAEKLVTKIQKGKPGVQVDAREFLRRIEQVHGIELNPLLVTVFAATAEYSRQDIPANITELFKKFTELMLGRWDEGKGLQHQYQAPLKDFLLRQIAFQMHHDRTTVITREAFESHITNELNVRGHSANAPQILQEIVDRSGLFRVIDDNIEFRHHLLQEFFAGRGIGNVDFIKQVVRDEWWKRAIVFYFGENPGQIASLKEVMHTISAGLPGETFEAVTTVGLALQACYLSEVTEKLDTWKWVATTLASMSKALLESDGDHKKYPVTSFIYYYLFGRDSVALSNLKENYGAIDRWITEDKSLQSDEERETRRFWLISALIEVGALDAASRVLEKFHPKDSRQILAVYLGCRINAEVRLGSPTARQRAREICESLESRVQALRGFLMKEFRSQLLEVRRGEITVVDAAHEPEK